MRSFAARCRTVNRAVGFSERSAIVVAVMHERVHALANEHGRTLEAEHAGSRLVAERAHAVQVDSVDALGCRVEEQANLLLAVAQRA